MECPECDGRGWRPTADGGQIIETPHQTVVTPAAMECETCHGSGEVDPREIEDEGPDPDDLRDREFDDRMNGE